MIELTPSDEQQMLIEAVHRFSESDVRPIAHDADETCLTPPEVIEKGWNLGILPGLIPEEFGGFGGEDSAVTGVLALEELGWGDVSIAIKVLTPAIFALAVLHSGTNEQRKEFLPKFCDADRPVMTAAVMEPSVKFDPFAPQTVASKSKKQIVLNGEKTYVPLANDATNIIVCARDLESGSVEGYVIEAGSPGLQVEEQNSLMGLRPLPTYRLKLENVKVSSSCQLRGSNSSPFRTVISRSRVALAALAVGQSRAAYEYARDYAKSRQQFGVPIATKQAIAFKLADMAVEVDGARLMVWEAAWQADRGEDITAAAAILKQHVAKVALFVADSAVQILGGHGYIREHPVERWLRNARGFATFEGLAMA